MVVGFDTLVHYAEQYRLVDGLFPFLLIFTLIFAVLQKTKIFGADGEDKRNKNINIMIAFLLAAMVVVPHFTGHYGVWGVVDVVDLLATALPNVVMIGLAVLMLLLIIGVWGHDVNIADSSLAPIAVLFSVVAVGYIFISASRGEGAINPVTRWINSNPELVSVVVAILVFGVIVFFITGDDRSDDDSGEFWKGLGKAFNKR